MANAFQELFNEGYQQILIIGSDCVELSDQVISRAFELLRDNKVVIGPSEDGGYYLLGMTNFLPYLISNKQWGTDAVFRDTLEDLSKASINAAMLEMLNDIDEEKDIPNSLLQLIRDENPS